MAKASTKPLTTDASASPLESTSAVERAGEVLEAAREADRQWRAARLTAVAGRVRRLLRLADRVERSSTTAMCLLLAIGSLLIGIGLDSGGPYFSTIPRALPLGFFLALVGFSIPYQYAEFAVRLRGYADAMLRREGFAAGDLPE